MMESVRLVLSFSSFKNNLFTPGVSLGVIKLLCQMVLSPLMLVLLVLTQISTTAYVLTPRSKDMYCSKGRKVSPGYCTSDKGILPRCFQARKNSNDAKCASACAKEEYCEYYSVGKGQYSGNCVLFGKNMLTNVASHMSSCYGGNTGNPNSRGTYQTTWNACIEVKCVQVNFLSK